MKTLKFLRRMGKPALQQAALIKIAFYSFSPSVAFRSARELGWSKRLANSCRYLAIIRRDHGNSMYEQVVYDALEYDFSLANCYGGAWGYSQILFPSRRDIDSGCSHCDFLMEENECWHIDHACGDDFCRIGCGQEIQEDYAECDNEGQEDSRVEIARKTADDNFVNTTVYQQKNPLVEKIMPKITCGDSFVDKISERIQSVAGTSYPVIIIEKDYINGYANGSQILLTRGLVNTRDSDVLAHVIAHEVVHNSRFHIADSERLGNAYYGAVMKYATRGSFLGAIAMAFIGTLHSCKQSRDHERESDKIAKFLMLKAGYNPKGAISYLRDSQGGGWFDSHPSGQEREEILRAA